MIDEPLPHPNCRCALIAITEVHHAFRAGSQENERMRQTIDIQADQYFQTAGPRWASFLTADAFDGGWPNYINETFTFRVHSSLIEPLTYEGTVTAVSKSRFTKGRWRVMLRLTSNQAAGRVYRPMSYASTRTLHDAVAIDQHTIDTIRHKQDVINNALQGERAMAPKNGKRPRFYVGSKQATTLKTDGTCWAKYTEKEAIEHATKLVEQTGEEQFIVKVIKIVRRKPMPIVVESVK